MDCVSLYNNAGLISKVSEDIASESIENWLCRQHHCRLTTPAHRTPANIRINLILPETRLTALHWNFRGGLQKTHVLCNRVRNGRSRSSKVVDSGTNRKRVYDFLLVINSNLGPILHRLRYGDLLAENCEFFLSYSHLTPSLGMNLFEFLIGIFIAKTKSSLANRRCTFCDPSMRRFDTVPACDRRTYRQTDNSSVANTGLCIASYAAVL